MDGAYYQHGDADQFSASYFSTGAIANIHGAAGLAGLMGEINQNAVFDAFRRMSQIVRCINRKQLYGYSVEGGKSVLWFRRFALGLGSSETQSQVYTGEIEANRVYEVHGTTGDSVDYNGVNYLLGDTFIGASGVTTFDEYGSTPTVWLVNPGILSTHAGSDLFGGIADAIRTVAPVKGWTNRWLLDMDLIPYRSSNSSVFKVDAFADWFGEFNRCHFWSPDIAASPELLQHFSFGQKAGPAVMFSEAPSGFNYAWSRVWVPGYGWDAAIGGRYNVNGSGATRAFYKSCQIYRRPYEIETAETVDISGTQYVKVTLTTRLQNTAGETDGAPASISADRSTWIHWRISGEPYRTDENGLRLYLINRDTDLNAMEIKPGDRCSNPSTNPGAWSAIIPRFYLVKLIPGVRVDDNDTQEPTDTPLWSDTLGHMEFALRAMCEGWVNPSASATLNDCQVVANDCANAGHGLYHFTFEDLNVAATADGKWLYTFGTEATTGLTATDVRPDKPYGYGPLQRTIVSSEVFNRYSKAANLLTTVAVMLPWKMEKKTSVYLGSATLTHEEVDDCGEGSSASQWWGSWEGTPPSPSAYQAGQSDADWVEVEPGEPLYAATESYIEMESGTLQWTVYSRKTTVQWRFKLVDPDAIYAIPAEWRDHLGTTTNGGLFCHQELDQDPERSSTENPCGVFDAGCGFVLNLAQSAECTLALSGNLDKGGVEETVLYTVGSSGLDCAEAGAWGRASWLTPIGQPEVFVTFPLL